jgi:hypothetical protein
MRVHQLLESFSADEFRNIVNAKVREFDLKLGNPPDLPAGDNFGECDFWFTQTLQADVYGLGIAVQTGTMNFGELVDKDSPAYQKIQAKLARSGNKPRWMKVGECAEAIATELAKHGLVSIEVPHYYQDRHGELLSGSYMVPPDFKFTEWLTNQGKKGMEEVEDEFFFYFKKIQLDYDGYSGMRPDDHED